MNLLCYGDNLAVLRRHIADESVDLIYLDPPFNSNASDNVLFAERDVRPAPLRIKTFEDTWRWDEGAAGAYEEVMQAGGQVMLAMRAFWRFLGDTDLLAYLAMMAPRLVELRRVLKPTGSIYLHCDPTASHYLKMLMDAVFGAAGFRNEIICKRNAGHGDTNHPSNRFGNSTDTILFYAKTGTNVFHSQFAEGHDERKGQPVQSLWDDIEMIGSQSAERRGYPTQKPEALLERIIRASSSEGAVVLDPFCGGGTTLAAAHTLKRDWIGIDMTHLAIALVRHRLRGAYGNDIEQTYRVIGGPASVADAKELAASDQDQFQWWALGLVGAHPNGRIYFHDGDGTTRQIILTVKAGKLHPSDIHDLRGIVDREQAAMGILLTLDEPTKAMRTKAASAGFYESRGRQHPRLQVVTVGELLGGKRVDIPPARSTL